MLYFLQGWKDLKSKENQKFQIFYKQKAKNEVFLETFLGLQLRNKQKRQRLAFANVFFYA